MNISFPSEVCESIIKISQDNVGLLQEICYKLCENHEIWTTQDTHITIGTVEEVREIAKEIADDQSGRYSTFIIKFAEGLSATELEMYKWIIWTVITSSTDSLRSGLSQNTIYHKIKQSHPKATTLQQNNVLQALERVHSVQFKNKLQPLILDYSNSELFVVDANFLVYLQTQKQEDLLAKIGM